MTEWTVPGVRRMNGTWRFNADGTYEESFLDSDQKETIVMKGSWRWSGPSTLVIDYREMTINPVGSPLTASDTFELTIEEISPERIKAKKRPLGKGKDTAPEVNITYVAVSEH
jgi:hypothetical protein